VRPHMYHTTLLVGGEIAVESKYIGARVRPHMYHTALLVGEEISERKKAARAGKFAKAREKALRAGTKATKKALRARGDFLRPLDMYSRLSGTSYAQLL
jgi:hypothetical protein